MRNLSELALEAIQAIIERVKKAGEWDGSASNYEDAEQYCSACLIDVSGDEKRKTYCKLPVKLPGGGEMIWEGVVAAAGALAGARSELKKPEGVTDSDWGAAIKSAANKIISAYNEMGETAPDSVYEAAGKERDLEYNQIAGQIIDWMMDELPQGYLHGLYQSDNGQYAIVSSNGKLYRYEFTVSDSQAKLLGEPTEVAHSFEQVSTRVIRQKDGRHRFLTRSATSVLNRVGEIDSQELLQDLADNFAKHDIEVLRMIAHEGERYRTGVVDTVLADGNQLILSGLYDEDNLLAELEIEARQKAPDKWGDSIGYDPLEWSVERIDVTKILVMRRGVLVEVSTLLEKHAANLFTSGKIISREDGKMKRTTLEALLELAENDEGVLREVLEFAGESDEIESLIAQARLITREADSEADDDSDCDNEDGEVVIEVGDEIVREVIESDEIVGMQEALAESVETLRELATTVESLAARIDELEADDETRLRELLQDAPDQPAAVRIVRARQRAEETEPNNDELTPEAMAENALAKVKSARAYGG